MPGMFGMSWALAIDESSRNTQTTLPDDNASFESVVFVVNGVIVVLAGPLGRQRVRLPALSGREKADDVDLGAVTMLGVRSALNIMRQVVVVDEGHAPADGNRRFERNQPELSNRHTGR